VVEMSDIEGVPQPRPKSRKLVPTIIAVIIVAVVVIITGYFVYQNSLQPNIQVTDVHSVRYTHPTTTTWLDLGRVRNDGHFNDMSVDLGGDYVLVFDNSFSLFSDKYISLQYTTHWPDYQSRSFYVTAGQTKNLTVHVNEGQQLGGDFTVSGGSGNDINFHILANTCSETVLFTCTLVNSGNADGYAEVVFAADGTAVWSNKYYVRQNTSLPINGSITINDCDDHTFNIVIQRQYK